MTWRQDHPRTAYALTPYGLTEMEIICGCKKMYKSEPAAEVLSWCGGLKNGCKCVVCMGVVVGCAGRVGLAVDKAATIHGG